MNGLKRFLWQFDIGSSYESLKIGFASIIPGLGFWISGYPKYAMLTVFAFAISLAAFIFFPMTALWYVLCMVWMAQIFFAVALEELKVPVEPPGPLPTQTFLKTRRSLSLPEYLPKGEQALAQVKQELVKRVPPHNKLFAYVAGIEDETSQCWYVGLADKDLILINPAQPGEAFEFKTISRNSIAWTYLVVGLRNHLLSFEYKPENSQETQTFLLHIPGNWHKQALALVKELPGTTLADEYLFRGIERLLPQDGNFQLLLAGFSFVGLVILMIGFLIQDIFFPEIFFGLPSDILTEFALTVLVYLAGWPFTLQVIFIFRRDPASIIKRGLASSGFMLIGGILWFAAILISHHAVMKIIGGL